jgi:hypothetical protein
VPELVVCVGTITAIETMCRWSEAHETSVDRDCFLLLSLELGCADWQDQLKLGGNKATNQPAILPSELTSLSQEQMTQGLKAALGKGCIMLLGQLGHQDDFSTNLNVKIARCCKRSSGRRRNKRLLLQGLWL